MHVCFYSGMEQTLHYKNVDVKITFYKNILHKEITGKLKL